MFLCAGKGPLAGHAQVALLGNALERDGNLLVLSELRGGVAHGRTLSRHSQTILRQQRICLKQAWRQAGSAAIQLFEMHTRHFEL